MEWKKRNSPTETFQLFEEGEAEPILIHVIKTGFKDKYMVVYEDAYEMELGNVKFHTKEEMENLYKIKLEY